MKIEGVVAAMISKYPLTEQGFGSLVKTRQHYDDCLSLTMLHFGKEKDENLMYFWVQQCCNIHELYD